MSEPSRWRTSDAISPELRALLRTAAPPSPLPDPVRRRVLTRLSTLAPLATVFGMSLKAAATTFVASAVVSSAAIVGVHEWQTAQSEEPTNTQEPAKALAAGAPRPATTGPAAPPEPPVDETLDETSLPSPTATPRHVAKAPVQQAVAKPARSRLEQEAALLERARAALQSSPRVALGQAQQHAQSFPNGQLRAERMFIEADALRRLGRMREARAKAEQALEQYPGGLYAERVRQFLDGLRE